MKFEIEKIELTPIHVPFKEPVIKAMSEGEGGLGFALGAEEAWPGGDFVICKIFCKSGEIGLGEAFVWLPETGVSPFQIIEVVKNSLVKYVIGENPFNIEKINHRMDLNLARNEVAKGLIDMACYDLMGKLSNLPACYLIGGKFVDEIPIAALIPLADPMLVKGILRSYYKKGFRNFRLKLGKSVENDLEIVQIIRKTFGNEIRLRVDYNQAYTPSTAIRAIKAIEPYGIDFAEQPVKASDYIGMAFVQERVYTPLMAHEGFFSLGDFINLVEMKAVRVLGLNSERPGGVTKALKALNYAKMRGLDVVLHNQPLGIASAMHIHFTIAKYPYIDHATELFGQEMLQDDLIIDPIDYCNGMARISEKDGWGVKLDERALNKYAIDSTTILDK
jgi:muconate cycloisomerase